MPDPNSEVTYANEKTREVVARQTFYDRYMAIRIWRDGSETLDRGYGGIPIDGAVLPVLDWNGRRLGERVWRRG